VIFDPWIRDSGWKKKSGSGSRMNILGHFSESLETQFLGSKYFNPMLRIRDLDPVSGIQDKHPGPQH
jgi:hypothetical protein